MLGFTYVLFPDKLALTESPFKSSRAIEERPPDALKTVRVFGNNGKADDDLKWLVSWSIGTKPNLTWKCAWAKPEGLLVPEGEVNRDTLGSGPKPLQMRHLIDDPQNLLLVKAIVHNQRRSNNEHAKAFRELGKPETTDIPASTTAHVIYDSHDFFDVGPGLGEPGTYYLIGAQGTRETDLLYGWLHGHEFYPQSSLMALGVTDENVKIWTVNDPSDPKFDGPDREPVEGNLVVVEAKDRATQKHLVLSTYPDSTTIRKALKQRQDIKVDAYRVVLPTIPCTSGQCVAQDPNREKRNCNGLHLS